MQRYSAIPTSIICGFLGAGKTTAIQYLLQQCPENERWAVIVNEFGQVGIDGELLKNNSVTVREIPGGCLCCVGSQSLNVGLNQVIRSVNPHRIIIEPTGLGHPANLIASLRGEHYRSVLDLKAVITLLDARQLCNEKYTAHETFIDQVQMADILVASKSDTYTEKDRQLFYDYAASLNPAKLKLAMIEQGRLDINWLELAGDETRSAVFPGSHLHHHEHSSEHNHTLDSSGWLQVEGRADGFVSSGWRIDRSTVFLYISLHNWLTTKLGSLSLDRVKGILRTEQGWLSINMTRQDSTLELLSQDDQQYKQSRLEIILMQGSQPVNFSELNQQLLDLRIIKDDHDYA